MRKLNKWTVTAFILLTAVFSSCRSNSEVKVAKEVEKIELDKTVTGIMDEPYEKTNENVEPVHENEDKNNEFRLGENEDYSRLTGLPINKDKIKRRPIAVMINNLKPATPQSGLSAASVIYEAPVEGYITRFMAIFDDWDNIDKIGSIRSARTYYVRFAGEFDAYLVHVGEAYNARRLLGRDNSIGFVDDTIFRDRSKKAPHNAFTSGEKLNRFFIKNKRLRTELKENNLNHNLFLFNDKDTDIQNTDKEFEANNIDLSKVYVVNKPTFVYDKDKKMYQRQQYGTVATDANNNEELLFKNVIIQFTYGNVFDKKGRWNINETGGGDGYYFTNGRFQPIKWTFNNGRTHYLDSNTGNEIKLNRGKTWICIAINNKKQKLVIK